jgi:HKD family nuclease
MPIITLQKPSDQPLGKWRLIDDLKANLASGDFNSFYILVAYAKVSPLLKMEESIIGWNAQGKIIHAVFGIDQKGTSKEALLFALDKFKHAYVAHSPKGTLNPTFHPKIYIFAGQEKAIAYVGSNNLTVGGIETNFESLIKLELSLPQEKDFFDNLLNCWNDSLMVSQKLTSELISKLINEKLICTEEEMSPASKASGQAKVYSTADELGFPAIKIIPPSPLPPGKSKSKPKTQPSQAVSEAPSAYKKLPAIALAIQIVPHHNGEVFLSKIAINQNPSFFGWPFTGKSTSKKANNPEYPQKVPDPIVNITVYDKMEIPISRHAGYNLNTVYYEKKSEIRITVPQNVVKNAPAYSIMVMQFCPQESQQDYDIEIYAPGSSIYDTYLKVCNQKMPSGGKAVARRFGWL